MSRNPDLYTEADDQEDMQRDEDAFCQLQFSTASLPVPKSSQEDVYDFLCGERGAIQSPSPHRVEMQCKE